MELLQLRYFADAARTENFSHTAIRNMVPQSTISEAIKKLEIELGVSLFDRRANKVILNEKGKTFQKGVESALNELDNALRVLEDSKGEVKGDISLLVQTNRRLVTKCIYEFKKLYPNVNFSIYHEYFGVDYDKFDICISDQNYGLKNADRELLITENILIAFSKEHPLAKRKSVNMKELAKERFISMQSGRSLHKLLITMCHNSGFEPHIAIQCDDPYYLREYVAMNLGIALFPELSWRGMFDDRVSLIEIDDAPVKRDTYVYGKTSKYMSHASKVFRDYIIENFKAE
jgi:LysR family transcriptional regulator, transcription activator of glutamate synthase operon